VTARSLYWQNKPLHCINPGPALRPAGRQLYAELWPEHHLNWIDDSIFEEYQSGYVGLRDQRVISIAPNAIQLFPGKKEALHNQQRITQIVLN
jgi:hypothetical protein